MKNNERGKIGVKQAIGFFFALCVELVYFDFLFANIVLPDNYLIRAMFVTMTSVIVALVVIVTAGAFDLLFFSAGREYKPQETVEKECRYQAEQK